MRVEIEELVDINDELVQLNDDLERRQRDYDELVAVASRYTVVVGSSSWRLTRPLRRIGEVLRRLIR
jgi:hypothetical protein